MGLKLLDFAKNANATNLIAGSLDFDSAENQTGRTGHRKTQLFVNPFTVNVHSEPRRAARRGNSLFLHLK